MVEIFNNDPPRDKEIQAEEIELDLPQDDQNLQRSKTGEISEEKVDEWLESIVPEETEEDN